MTALIITLSVLGLIALLIIIAVVYDRSRVNAAVRSQRNQLAHWRYAPDEWQNLVAVFNQNSRTLRPLKSTDAAEVIISRRGIVVGSKLYAFTELMPPEFTFENGSRDLLLLRFKIFNRSDSGGRILAVELVFPAPRGHEQTVNDINSFFNRRKD